MRTRFLLAASLSLLLSSCGGNSQQNGFSAAFEAVFGWTFEPQYYRITQFSKLDNLVSYSLLPESKINKNALLSPCMKVAEGFEYREYKINEENPEKFKKYFAGRLYQFNCEDARSDTLLGAWELFLHAEAVFITFETSADPSGGRFFGYEGNTGGICDWLDEALKNEKYGWDQNDKPGE